jgi:hypothetical protein
MQLTKENEITIIIFMLIIGKIISISMEFVNNEETCMARNSWAWEA